MNTRTLAIALMLAAAPAFAEAPTTDLAKLEGGQFALDKNHAKIIFSISHFGFSTYYGLFSSFDAKLAFDPKAPAKSDVAVTVDMNGIDTTNPKLDAHLKSADFFDVAKFPTATFKTTKVEVTGATTGKISGELTLHGITKPLVLETSFNGGGVNPMSKAYVVGFNATATLKRSDWGITTYVPVVGDEVGLIISGEFDRVQ